MQSFPLMQFFSQLRLSHDVVIQVDNARTPSYSSSLEQTCTSSSRNRAASRWENQSSCSLRMPSLPTRTNSCDRRWDSHSCPSSPINMESKTTLAANAAPIKPTRSQDENMPVTELLVSELSIADLIIQRRWESQSCPASPINIKSKSIVSNADSIRPPRSENEVMPVTELLVPKLSNADLIIIHDKLPEDDMTSNVESSDAELMKPPVSKNFQQVLVMATPNRQVLIRRLAAMAA